MNTQVVKLNDTVRVFATLLVDGDPTDPNTLTLKITNPGGSETTYEWNIDPEIVRDSEGAFHFDLFINTPGTWLWEWYSNSSLTAMDSGQIVTAGEFQLVTQDGSSAAIAFADFKVTQSGRELCVGQTDENGEASVALDPGNYSFSAFKQGVQFVPVNIDLVNPGGGSDVVIQGYVLDQSWLKISDLEAAVSVETVDRLFHDDNSGVRDPKLLQQVIQQAEALAESKLLRNWSREQVHDLAFHDPAVRFNGAWIALEMATERRGEFVAADGRGRFWAQYERAIAFFDALGKSKDHSRGQQAKKQLGVPAAGSGAQTGGSRKPALRQGESAWVFADEGSGRKHGGF